MTTTRKILVGAALGLAALGVGTPADASPAPADAAADLSTPDDQDVAAKRCRWVWGKGLICNTDGPFGTINV